MESLSNEALQHARKVEKVLENYRRDPHGPGCAYFCSPIKGVTCSLCGYKYALACIFRALRNGDMSRQEAVCVVEKIEAYWGATMRRDQEARILLNEIEK